MKFICVVVLACALGLSQGQLNFGMNFGMKSAFGGIPPGQFFQTIVLQSEAEKLLVNPDLPEDLRQRVLDSMSNAEEGFNNCGTTGTLPWMQIRCSALQLQKSKTELKAIENEATARAQAAANAAAAAASTAVV
ncbi:uncharacterized protein LOC106091688 [Stomoxys calcitrans]|uniref:Secreted protein n=1 Tax=Stomoxys calcitrans TaxID=35570 RepID=A0A1I8NZN7_STOCA|nr:uncharacterized protein LOC106091688 [Stomoxys calcitrans]